eukprot:7803482-Pyramimonas_sp.AAC.1
MEKHIPKDKIISVPMRHVRTNRGKAQDIEAKSPLIIPGQRDPQLGLFRTDSPTTSSLAVLVCATIAISFDWSFEVFDVATAFLSGMRLDRELYVRAPRDGLPSPPGSGWPPVRPYALL